MQPATDDGRWLALWLRWACKPDFSVKFDALSGSSLRTIEKFLRLNVDKTEIGVMKADLDHRKIMLRAGIGLGFSPAEIAL